MKIQRATFIGVRGVPDLTLDLTDARSGAPHALVVLSGPSGSGKTRLLEAILAAKEAIRPYGALTPAAPWIAAGEAAKILLTFHLSEEERAFAGTTAATLEGEVIFRPDRASTTCEDGLKAVLGRFSHNRAYGKVDYFPVERRIPTFPPFGNLGPAEQRVIRLGKDARKYGFVVSFLRTLVEDAPRRERFEANLAALSTTCRLVREPSNETLPRCFTSRGGAPVTVFELSHGESDAVLIAATAAAIGLDHSLIFVDRPDLHADDLERLVSGLAALGPDNQIWIAGGSALAAAAPDARIVTLKGA